MHQGKKEFKKEGKVEESAGVTGHPIYALVVPAPPIAPTHQKLRTRARLGGENPTEKRKLRKMAHVWVRQSGIQWGGIQTKVTFNGSGIGKEITSA